MNSTKAANSCAWRNLVAQKILIFLALVSFFSAPAFAAEHNMSKNNQEIRVRIAFDNEEAIVTLFDNPASRDFAALLPLSVTFKDYAQTEKITYLPRKLTTRGGLSGNDAQGDFCYYAPWGNLAVFYKGFGSGNGLYILGRIESGKERLAKMDKNFSARIEVIE